MSLSVETWRTGIGTNTMKVTGFSEKELDELNSMDYRDMKETVLDCLDERCGGIGSAWHNAYGVYQMWIREGAVFVEVGNNSH